MSGAHSPSWNPWPFFFGENMLPWRFPVTAVLGFLVAFFFRWVANSKGNHRRTRKYDNQEGALDHWAILQETVVVFCLFSFRLQKKVFVGPPRHRPCPIEDIMVIFQQREQLLVLGKAFMANLCWSADVPICSARLSCTKPLPNYPRLIHWLVVQ